MKKLLQIKQDKEFNKNLEDLTKEVTQISIKDYNFFWGIIFFTDDGSQNILVH